MAKTRHNGPKTELESLSRAPGTFSQGWKVSPARRRRFPKAGKSPARARQGFQRLESLPRKPGKVSSGWKVSRASPARFPAAGKSPARARQGFQSRSYVIYTHFIAYSYSKWATPPRRTDRKARSTPSAPYAPPTRMPPHRSRSRRNRPKSKSP